MGRFSFILRRPLQLLPVLFGISVITFVLVHSIPGDPARTLLGPRSTPAAIERIREQFGLNEPLWVQYVYFVKNLLHGEMGKSILYKVDSLKLIASRIEPTLFLVLGAVVLALVIAVPLATASARNRGGGASITLFACSVPPVWDSPPSGWASC
ncbi:MAG: ABC transporter permease [Rhodospirillum sp.]|nr:ABC transporter permease [Rhodospirillum sp.]MCF8489593.1 ABC transporter permease [Rhodospirillum sp.]MCF8502831.1 ABC transporter permease [Rhodospirillum sp.]